MFNRLKNKLITVEVRKSLLCGYLPANILSYKVINEKPESVSTTKAEF